MVYRSMSKALQVFLSPSKMLQSYSLNLTSPVYACRRAFTFTSTCSTSLNAHQAAERCSSAQKCSTSYSSSEHSHGVKGKQHQQQESRKCMWMERRALLLGVASLSAAMGLGAPKDAQVRTRFQVAEWVMVPVILQPSSFIACSLGTDEQVFLMCGVQLELAMQASKLPAAVDRAWEAVGGGPADLFFPEVCCGLYSHRAYQRIT